VLTVCVHEARALRVAAIIITNEPGTMQFK
jgi:hypothetical protein